MPSPRRAASSPTKIAETGRDSAVEPVAAVEPVEGVERVDYGRVASVYDLLSWVYTGGQIARLKQSQAARFAPGARVLYAGVGTGEELLSALDAGARPTALDASPAMLERAKSRLGARASEVRFCSEDVFAHTAPEPYDIVVANFFLNVFAESLLPRISRRLTELVRPGGSLLVGDFAPPVDSRLERALQRAYYWPPLALFRLLTRNPWHALYDYRPVVEGLGLRLVAHDRVRIFGIGPSWLSTLSFVKGPDAER